MEYEEQKDKTLWPGEKVLLAWAGSKLHQHLGSPIDGNHLKDAFDFSVSNNFIKPSEREGIIYQAQYITTSLVTHEFATLYDDSNPKNPRIKINRNGILAGQILIETKNLTQVSKYKRWSWNWYLLYYLAGLLLAVQVLKGFTELILLWWKNFPKN